MYLQSVTADIGDNGHPVPLINPLYRGFTIVYLFIVFMVGQRKLIFGVSFGSFFFFATLKVSELHSVGWVNEEVERISENPRVEDMYGFIPPPPPHSIAHDRLRLISLPFRVL
jgi:hypothetical protein